MVVSFWKTKRWNGIQLHAASKPLNSRAKIRDFSSGLEVASGR